MVIVGSYTGISKDYSGTYDLQFVGRDSIPTLIIFVVVEGVLPLFASGFYTGVGDTPLPTLLGLSWKGEIKLKVINIRGFYSGCLTILAIHPDAPPEGTKGCIGIICSSSEEFFKNLSSYFSYNDYITV